MKEVLHEGLTETEIVDDLMTRKTRMMEHSKDYVILPGGLGTLDEFFEVLTWKQLGQIDGKIIVVNHKGFFTGLLSYIDELNGAGLVYGGVEKLFDVVDDIDGLVAKLKA